MLYLCPMSQEITPTQLKERLDQGEDLQLIDVREPEEWTGANLGGQCIPFPELPKQVSRLDKNLPTILICYHGFKSAQALLLLQHRFGFTNLLNLKGGLHAWAQEVDPTFQLP